MKNPMGQWRTYKYDKLVQSLEDRGVMYRTVLDGVGNQNLVGYFEEFGAIYIIPVYLKEAVEGIHNFSLYVLLYDDSDRPGYPSFDGYTVFSTNKEIAEGFKSIEQYRRNKKLDREWDLDQAIEKLPFNRVDYFKLVMKVLKSRKFGKRTTVNVTEITDNYKVPSIQVIKAFQWAQDVTGGRLRVSTTAGLNSISGGGYDNELFRFAKTFPTKALDMYNIRRNPMKRDITDNKLCPICHKPIGGKKKAARAKLPKGGFFYDQYYHKECLNLKENPSAAWHRKQADTYDKISRHDSLSDLVKASVFASRDAHIDSARESDTQEMEKMTKNPGETYHKKMAKYHQETESFYQKGSDRGKIPRILKEEHFKNAYESKLSGIKNPGNNPKHDPRVKSPNTNMMSYDNHAKTIKQLSNMPGLKVNTTTDTSLVRSEKYLTRVYMVGKRTNRGWIVTFNSKLLQAV